jgi:hypothetical protein
MVTLGYLARLVCHRVVLSSSNPDSSEWHTLLAAKCLMQHRQPPQKANQTILAPLIAPAGAAHRLGAI